MKVAAAKKRVATDGVDLDDPSGSSWNQHAHPLPGAPLSMKSSRQSTEGYTHSSRRIGGGARDTN